MCLYHHPRGLATLFYGAFDMRQKEDGCVCTYTHTHTRKARELPTYPEMCVLLGSQKCAGALAVLE